jgi:hypothetical protein
MSKLQLLTMHAAYLRQLEHHLAVASGKRRDQLQTKLRTTRSKLNMLLRRSAQ